MSIKRETAGSRKRYWKCPVESDEMKRRALRAGTEGLANLYEQVTFDEVHRQVLHLIPVEPARVLEIGAGAGRDAAALSARGHTVVAVEPSDEFRGIGQRVHAGHRIQWVNDKLPELGTVARLNRPFQLIMLTAVWMFLHGGERDRAVSRIQELLSEGGRLGVVLRIGPVPYLRRRLYLSPPLEGSA
ncbi:methyltransferase domain-containing protein [Streptomyces sp. NPDC053493]|uniref:methyltransferase domain-containing protein n=1 Tax=Streptomyces sp. NPDC053493 TaxID=3365705 RepID=UPI0037D36CAD